MMLLLVITGCVALIGYLVAWCRTEDREQARYAASCRAADLAYLAAGGDPTWPPVRQWSVESSNRGARMSGLIILNSSEVGTETYQTALAASAIRGAERTMTLCDNLEKQGRTAVSIDWLRATFAPFATGRQSTGAESAE